MSPLIETLADVTARTAFLNSQPAACGVYLMRDAAGKVIYVGKALNLRKRLASYLKTSEQADPKTRLLIRRIVTIETIITGTENEALILEATLIKRHRPRYNVILKDGKRYPSLYLDTHNPWPHLIIVRQTPKRPGQYFGPFSSPGAVHQTLKLIHKTFKLRKCTSRTFRKRTRPCLQHQIGACYGPCCLPVDAAMYQAMVREVVLFLKGRTPELLKQLRQDMLQAAEKEAFEEAAQIRDRIFALERVLEKQVAVTTDFRDRDALALSHRENCAVVMLLAARGGYLSGKQSFEFVEILAPETEILEGFIRQYYEKAGFIPPEILISQPLENAALLEAWLSQKASHKVHLHAPQRGEKHRLITMARQNADNALAELTSGRRHQATLLERLQQRLKLSRRPQRIECFDNSSFGGRHPVAAMVVFEAGQPLKSDYRKFHLKSVTCEERPQWDDYAAMQEVLERRFSGTNKTLPRPDLLILDGGKGQLQIALNVCQALNLTDEFDILALAKKDPRRGESQDKIYRPGRANPVTVGRDTDLLLFLARIRDEAHRFAIGFQRQSRKAPHLHSILDDLSGIGPRRKRQLLQHFGSINRLRQATIEELSALPEISPQLAASVLEALRVSG